MKRPFLPDNFLKTDKWDLFGDAFGDSLFGRIKITLVTVLKLPESVYRIRKKVYLRNTSENSALDNRHDD